MTRLLRGLSLVALLLGPTACRGTDAGTAPTGGTIIVATNADADALTPTHWKTSPDRMLTELLFDPLVEIGPGLNTAGDAGFAPRLASRWTRAADSLSISFTLNPAAKWHDGQRVVARDAVAAFRVLKGPHNSRSLKTEVAEIDSVTAPNDSTVVMHFARKSPYQLYFASHILPIPTHLTDAVADSLLETSDWAQRPVGSGPYRLARREPEVETELLAVVDHYRGRPGPDRILLSLAPSNEAGVARIFAGEADVWELLPAEFETEAAKYPAVRLIRSSSFNYIFASFNFRDPADTLRPHPFLRNAALRRALTMAIDREQNVRAVFGTGARAGNGPFARINSPADSTLVHIPYDTAAANRLLDSLGWSTRDRDGIRSKQGRRLSLTALVPAPSTSRQKMGVFLQEQLRRVGAEMKLAVAEEQEFTRRRTTGHFDVLLQAWATTPLRSSIQGTWGSFGRDPWGSQNDARYSNRDADSAIARAVEAMTPESAAPHYRRAYQLIVDDAAAIWLYEPNEIHAIHARFITPPWRAEAWWRTIPLWRVDPTKRLPRDAAPVTP